MKIVLLAGANSIHTVQWANGLFTLGIEVHIISQHPPIAGINKGVYLHLLPFKGMLGYFYFVPQVKKLLVEIKPDLVNAHYASGYATTAKLANYHPWLLSVWGSDVYQFPYKTLLHKWLVKSNLYAADSVASTSHCMAAQIKVIAPKLEEITITPFGVDIKNFTQQASTKGEGSAIVVGTVKSMSHIYGIDLLIKSFALVRNRLLLNDASKANRLQLRIVGGGPLINELKQLAIDEGVSEVTTFVGKVEHKEVPIELAKLDIFVALSREESFGVAVIESGAVGKPVVVSDIGGLPEVVIDGVTGFVVPPEDIEAASLIFERLITDEKLRLRLGAAGQIHVTSTYDWSICLKNMCELYEKVINDFRRD